MGLLSQGEKAKALLSFHTAGDLLVLPNIWNPLGARILEKKGYRAVATASAAISASLGYQDGEKIRRSTLVDLVGRIARSVNLPVTVDIESGYAESLPEMAVTVEQMLDSGIVGVNIEDSIEGGAALRTVEEQCQRISAVREVAVRRGIPLVINARIDSYLSSSFGSEEATAEAITRAQAYAEAGADCIYPIGPGDEVTVRLLRNSILSPLNILASPKALPLPLLREIGVNRVSFGPFLLWSCLRTFANITDSLLTTGDYSGLNGMMSKAEVAEYLVSGQE